jgi:hypothetical protein
MVPRVETQGGGYLPWLRSKEPVGSQHRRCTLLSSRRHEHHGVTVYKNS